MRGSSCRLRASCAPCPSTARGFVCPRSESARSRGPGGSARSARSRGARAGRRVGEVESKGGAMAGSSSTTPAEAAPKILDLPIGLDASGTREEFDSLGTVDVPANRYWGAQTQRSLEHFNIGNDRMPKEVYHAYGYVKKAAAVINTQAGRLPAWKGELIQRVCDEVVSGALDDQFPLYVWQTGSGTQSGNWSSRAPL